MNFTKYISRSKVCSPRSARLLSIHDVNLSGIVKWQLLNIKYGFLSEFPTTGCGASYTNLLVSAIDHFTVVAKLPGLRMEARLPVTLF